jgi:hypothetical protein
LVRLFATFTDLRQLAIRCMSIHVDLRQAGSQ